MAQPKIPYQINVDPEMAKKIDRRLDRSGWFYLVFVLGVLFLMLYLMISFFRIPTNESLEAYNHNQIQLEQRISDLEKKVDTYEKRLNELESKQSTNQ